MITNKKIGKYWLYIVLVLVVVPIVIYWLTAGINKDISTVENNNSSEVSVTNNYLTPKINDTKESVTKAESINIIGIESDEIETMIKEKLKDNRNIKNIVFVYPDFLDIGNNNFQIKSSDISLTINGKLCNEFSIRFKPLMPDQKNILIQKINVILISEIEANFTEVIKSIKKCLD